MRRGTWGLSVSAYKVVEDFEAALCAYTGAPYAVTTNSGTMAIFLCLMCGPNPKGKAIGIPKRTYCSVPMAAMQAQYRIAWLDLNWSGAYQLAGSNVWDSARRFTSGMYRAGEYQCVSFQTSKILGLEQGGAILHDNAKAYTWLRRARFDGRLNADEKLPQQMGWHAYMNPSTAALGLQRLACLPRDNPDQAGAADFPDLSELPCFR